MLTIDPKFLPPYKAATSDKATAAKSTTVVESPVKADVTDTVHVPKSNVSAAQQPDFLSSVGNFLSDTGKGILGFGKFVGDAAAQAWNSFTGLFNQASKSMETVNAELKKGTAEGKKAAADAAKEFLSKTGVQGVDNLSNDAALEKFEAAMREISEVGQLVKDGKLSAKQGLDRIAKASKSLSEAAPRLTNDQRLRATKAVTETVGVIVNGATAEQIKESAGQLAAIRSDAQVLVNSIDDAAMKKQAVALLENFDKTVPTMMANKLSAPDQTEAGDSFISFAKEFKSEFTDKVVAQIIENRKHQDQLDDNMAKRKSDSVAQEKNETEKRDIKKQDIKVADARKQLDRAKFNQNLQNLRDLLANDKKDAERLAKQINLDQNNKDNISAA